MCGGLQCLVTLDLRDEGGARDLQWHCFMWLMPCFVSSGCCVIVLWQCDGDAMTTWFSMKGVGGCCYDCVEANGVCVVKNVGCVADLFEKDGDSLQLLVGHI